MPKYLAVFAVNYPTPMGPAHGDLNAEISLPGKPNLLMIRQTERIIQERNGYPAGSTVLTNLIELEG